MNDTRKRTKKEKAAQGFALSTSYAGTMLLSMFLGYKGGLYLDEKTGASPIFLVLGLVAGVILGLYTVVQEILHFHRILSQRKAPSSAQAKGQAMDKDKDEDKEKEGHHG